MAVVVTSSPKSSSPPLSLLQVAWPADNPGWCQGPIPPHVKAMAGSLGGGVKACCLQPTDVVKTRLQLDRAGAGSAAYRGMAHCS